MVNLWNSGNDKDKEQARKQKRRLKYHSNILGNQRLRQIQKMKARSFCLPMGRKIFDKLNDLMNPQFEDETPVNPFDFLDWCKFQAENPYEVEKYPNYDKSEFDTPSELFDGDEDKLEEVYNQLHSLQELD
jgi:hypothetical protein